jgi:hypothetical protein
MSELLHTNRHFINFLLSAQQSQQYAVLERVTPEQTDVLGEIMHNISQLPKTSLEQGQVSKWRKLLVKLGNIDSSNRTRRRLIKKHKYSVVRIIGLFSAKLRQVLEDL